jgi:drug/metabolite transporter (DMT)-like permease
LSRVFAALLCTVLFSMSVVCGHRSAKLIGGTEANFWRLTFAALFLGAWAYGFGIGLGGNAFPVFLVSGIVGIGLGDVALFQALPRLGSRLSLLLTNCLTAPMAAFIEWSWLGTTLVAGQILCVVIILTGVGIALTPGEHLRLTRRELIVGIFLCLLSALGGAGGAVLSRKAYQLAHAAGQPIDGANAAFQRVVGGLLIAGICLLAVKRRTLLRGLRIRPGARLRRENPGSFQPAEQPPAQPMHPRRPSDGPGGTEPAGLPLGDARKKWLRLWPWVLVNSLAGQTLGVSCMQWALERTPTGIVLAIIAMTPIVVIPFARVVEGERASLHSLAGGGIAVAGVVALIWWR